MILTVASKVTLAPPHAERDVLQAFLALRWAYDSLARLVPQHEVYQMAVAARSMGIVTSRAWCLVVDDVLVMGKGIGSVVNQEVAVMTLIAERVILKRLRRQIVCLILSLEDRGVSGPVRAARFGPR